jgi:hypothetical protein
MARPHIEFINSHEVEPTSGRAPFVGANERRLSEDDETGAYTSLMRFWRGWRGDLGPVLRPIELFGLRGEMRLGSDRLGAGCYVYLESGLTSVVLAADEDALALVMVEDERAAGPSGTWEILDTEQMDYENSGFDGQIPPGLVIKKLRIDPETGDWTWMAASAPNRITPIAEIHSTVEEAFLIRGDCLLGECGEMVPGCYFWRPGMIEHGPMGNRNGSLFFFRTKKGGLDLKTVEVPGWEETVKRYRAREPYYRGKWL